MFSGRKSLHIWVLRLRKQKLLMLFTISVVNLKYMELATQEDREWKLDYWAALFKATTWEELKMLAQQSHILEEAVETIYDLTADEAIREQCKAREKYIREMNTVVRERDIAEKEKNIAVKEKEIAVKEKETAVKEKEAVLAKLEQSEQRHECQSQQIDQQSRKIDQQSQQIDQLSRQLEQLRQENECLKAQQ